MTSYLAMLTQLHSQISLPFFHSQLLAKPIFVSSLLSFFLSSFIMLEGKKEVFLFGSRIQVKEFLLFGKKIQVVVEEEKIGGGEAVKGCSSTCNYNSSIPRSEVVPTSSVSSSVTVNISPLNDHREEEEEKKRKRKRKRVESHPNGWEGVINDMGATQLTYVCTKSLTQCDTHEHQNRLLLPKADVEKHLLPFLTDEEDERLTREHRIPAWLVDAEGRQWETSFNYWASKSYNLNGDWSSLVETLGLSSTEHNVEVKAFRHGGHPPTSLGFLVLHQSKRH